MMVYAGRMICLVFVGLFRFSRYSRHHVVLTQRANVLVSVRPNVALNPSELAARTAASMKKDSCKWSMREVFITALLRCQLVICIHKMSSKVANAIHWQPIQSTPRAKSTAPRIRRIFSSVWSIQNGTAKAKPRSWHAAIWILPESWYDLSTQPIWINVNRTHT